MNREHLRQPGGKGTALVVKMTTPKALIGRPDDEDDQHVGDRPGEGQLSGLRCAVCAVCANGAVLHNRVPPRTRRAARLAEQPACVVAMEACATSHHRGRVAQGRTIRAVTTKQAEDRMG